MKIARMAGLTLAAFAALGGGQARAEDANAILKKAADAMKHLKSYQAVWDMNTQMGAGMNMNMQMNLKMLPAAGKTAMTMTMAGQNQPMMQVVDDGKTVYSYMAMMGGYSKAPHKATNSSNPVQQLTQSGTSAKLVRTENLNGKSVYVLQVTPKAPARPGMNQTILLFVDKSTYRMRQATVNMTMKNPQNGQTMNIANKMVVKSETIDAPISESVFKFTPPAGAKEIQGGMGAGLGGMMGGGGGGARPAPPRPGGR